MALTLTAEQLAQLREPDLTVFDREQIEEAIDEIGDALLKLENCGAANSSSVNVAMTLLDVAREKLMARMNL